MTDPASVRTLWENGFFGKGTLSRSEPTWLEREKRRRGISKAETAEEVTNRRRDERREMKMERARKARELVEQQLVQEGKMKARVDGITDADHDRSDANGELGRVHERIPINEPMTEVSTEGAHDTANQVQSSTEDSGPSTDAMEDTQGQSDNVQQDGDSIKNEEYLQLSFEEAFFLTYALGILQICSEKTQQRIANPDLLQLFRQHSYFPSRPTTSLELDDRFLLSYVVYHHFRSLGWVVRDGIKFAVDYLLYNRGPVFAHAEFAIIIVPAYEHPYWFKTPARAAETRRKTSKSWWWLHGVNRVQAQVRKSLILVYVEVPPPEDKDGVITEVADIGRMLKRYKVREFALKRWTPNRNRD